MRLCIICSGGLPPLDGSEENDFATTCETCELDQENEDEQ